MPVVEFGGIGRIRRQLDDLRRQFETNVFGLVRISDALWFEVKGFGVGVVIIQPGLIRTEFATTAQNGLVTDDGPNADFNASVGAATEDAYVKGPLAKLGGDPDSVAKAVEQAITAKRPPIRVRVTPSAHVLIGLNGLMTDSMWDRFLAGQFPRPAVSVGK